LSKLENQDFTDPHKHGQYVKFVLAVL